MSAKEVLLLKPLANLGHEGDLVKVKPGYARNFLFPQKLAVPVTQANKKQLEVLQKRKEARLAAELATAQEFAGKLSNLSISIAVKTGKGGKLFGAITAADVLKKLEEAGVTTVEKHALRIGEGLKTLGQHTIEVKVHPEVKAELVIEIVSENPIISDIEDEASDTKKSKVKKPRKPKIEETPEA